MNEKLPDGNAVDNNGNVVPNDDVAEFVELTGIDTAGSDQDYESMIRHETALAEIEAITREAGPAVDLGRRAVSLLAALNKYAGSNTLDGFQRSGKPMESKKAVAGARKEHAANAEIALKRAFGWDEMIASGMDAQDVQDMFVMARYGFRHKYLKPGDDAARNRRKAYRK